MKHITKRACIARLLDKHNNPELIQYILETCQTLNPSELKNRATLLLDIIETNGMDSAITLTKKYLNSNSARDKLKIRYGESKVLDYNKKLKRRPKPNNFSILDKNYWITREGYSETEAKEKVSQIQQGNVLRRTKKSYEKHANKIKFSTQYWLNLGYSEDESELLRQPYLEEMKNTLSRYVKKYGEAEGAKRYNLGIQRRLKTIGEKRVNGELKSPGYVSKESLKFFIPLYKSCRRLGIARSDIYLGVNGSREFFIRHNKKENSGRFFDFTIVKLGIVIEYNGTFWHPKESETDWKNPFIDYKSAIAIEREKQQLCEGRGYDLIYVWSDENLELAHTRCLNKIKEKLEDKQNG